MRTNIYLINEIENAIITHHVLILRINSARQSLMYINLWDINLT